MNRNEVASHWVTLSTEADFIGEINFTPEVAMKHLIVLASTVSASH